MNKPFFELSKSKVLEQFNILREKGFGISYSVKTNQEVAQVLEEMDCMFSIHSYNEIEMIKDKERIWFLAESWLGEDVEELLEKGINSFVVYNEKDLKVLLDVLESKEVKINLLLRLRLKENTIHTGRYFVFGFRAKELNENLLKLKDNDKIGKLGIHFHRKTQNISEWSLKEELEQSVNEEVLKVVEVINFGGGLPAHYKNVSDKAMDYIFKKLEELKEWVSAYEIDLICEAGRFIAAPAVKLKTKVVNKFGNNLVVNASVYNAAMDTMVVPIKLLVEGELKEGKSYVIKGCTPCSMDIFRYDVKLDEVEVGDEIVFLNAGAYNYHTDFGNLDKIETKVVE